MKQKKLYLNLLYFLSFTALLFTQAGCEKENVFPNFTITSLESGEQIPHGTQILIIAEADDANRRILYVDFYIDNIRVDRNNTFPYEYEWNTLEEETGIHIIRATAVDAGGQSVSHEISVTITEGDPIADFAAYPPSASLGSSTQFFNLSINNPVSWLWDFGDGNTSVLKDPNHTYSAEGTYTVSLTVTNSYGSDTKTIIDYFTVTIALTDYDGNVYQTVQIGNQLWMRENLKTTHYADGTSLLSGKEAGNIAGDYTAKYHFAPNNDETRVDIYGRLYTWAAAMNGAISSDMNPSGVQGVCPAGWHVPADDEWKQLELHLGMDKWEVNSILWRGEVGAKLKDNSGNYWSQSIFNLIPDNNESSFTALPAGVRKNRTVSIFTTGFWSTTEGISSHAWSRGLGNRYPGVHRSDDFKDSGYSVRCVKD